MSKEVSDRTIGVIGLGNMGSALAAALLARRYRVVVWNRTASRADPLVEQGATPAQSVTEAAGLADAIIICVTDQVAIELLLNDEVGAALKGKSLVQLGVVAAEEARATASWAQSRGIGYLEGSILGVPENVVAGKATIVCSGPPESFAEHREMLEVFGPCHHLSDSIGAAYQFDKIYYPFGYGAMLGYLQGAAMAKEAGYSIDVYTSIVTERVKLFADRFETFRDAIEREDYSVRMGSLGVWAEGYAQCVEFCRSEGVDDTLPAAHLAMMSKAIDAGFEDEEILAVFKTLLP